MRILKVALFVWLFFRVAAFCQKQTGGFTVHRVQPSHTNPSFHTAPPQWNIPSQRFLYHASGKQCFVFVSEDGQYVLKLFRRAHLMAPIFAQIPLLNRLKPFKPHKMERQVAKQYRDFMGYKIAFEHFQEETALIALHLNPEPAKLPTITLVDKIGVEHSLDLNKTSFALQHRALSFPEWLAQSNEKTIQEGIRAIFDLFQKRIESGISDDDPSPYKNFGFYKGKPIQIDPGQYQLAAAPSDHELASMQKLFIKWLRKNNPELIPYVETYTATR